MAKARMVAGTAAMLAISAAASAGVSHHISLLTGADAPGAPGTTFSAIIGAPGVNNSGQLILRTILGGVKAIPENDFAIYRVTNDVPELVAREGNQAVGFPSGVRFALDNVFPIPNMNDAGYLAFQNRVRGEIIFPNNDTAVWAGEPGAIMAVLKEDETPPGFPLESPTVLRGFSQLLLTGDGNLGIRAEIFTPSTPSTSGGSGLGIWVGQPGFLQLITVTGMPVDEIGPNVDVLSVAGMSLNDALEIAYNMIYIDRLALLFSSAFMTGPALDDQITLTTRSQAPFLPEGVLLDAFPGAPSIGSKGDAILYVLLAGQGVFVEDSQALYLLRDGELSLLHRTGGQAPGMPEGVITIAVEAPFGDISGTYAFRATLAGPGVDSTNNQSLMVVDGSDQLRPLMRTGDPAPEGRHDSVFANIRFQPAVNKNGQIAFVSNLVGNALPSNERIGIWATDARGKLRKVVQAGDQIEVAPGDFRTVTDVSFLAASGGENGASRGFNENSELAYTATFSDGSEAAIIATITADPAPDLSEDGAVSGMDLALLLADWGVCGNLCKSDLTGDGEVSGLDLALLLQAWNP